MLYRILADLVVFLHLLFIIFVVAGGLLVLRRAWLALLHLPTVLWAAYIELTGNICPLTPLENHFRRMAGEDGYSGGFIEHYLIPIIYPAGLTYEIQIFLGLFVVVMNLLLYLFFLRRHFGHS
ncbi:MAG: DUF2784 family protein [Desulforhopalus sp.]|jgi:hypothetical protein|nr:DUF2784 family protein [Desulforhopalus sp.]